MKILVAILLISLSLGAETLQIAGKTYLYAPSFGDDILDANYRQKLVINLKENQFFGVILTDYEAYKHYTRLKLLVSEEDESLEHLDILGERILSSFINYLEKEGFDVGLAGAAGIDLAERGLVSFAYFNQQIQYGFSLAFSLPLNYLPHQDWSYTFAVEKGALAKKVAREDAVFAKLSLISLQSLPEQNPLEAIEDFRSSLQKAGLRDTDLDLAWERLAEIALRIERQKRKYMYTGIL